MSSVNDLIVREYFEHLGYMVIQNCKYDITGRPKHADEEIDLIVVHPLRTEQRLPETMLWTSDDLKTISRAVVGVYGWHTERFYPAMLEQLPEICRFADKAALQSAAKRAGQPDLATILCIPQLPVSEKLRDEALSVLKQKGVNGVISFRTLLKELMDSVDKNKNYQKSDLLQILRILKNYDLIKTPQLELFGGRKRRQPKDKTPPAKLESPAVPA